MAPGSRTRRWRPSSFVTDLQVVTKPGDWNYQLSQSEEYLSREYLYALIDQGVQTLQA
jgi:hypothetical protein